MSLSNTAPRPPSSFIQHVHGIRYQVKDVSRAIAFYTERLGFKLEHQHLPQFAAVSCDGFMILLTGPGASGSRSLPGGQSQEPGGWNRIVLQTLNFTECVAALKQAGVHFRNDILSGPGGSQVQIEDPDGNPIELFQLANEKDG